MFPNAISKIRLTKRLISLTFDPKLGFLFESTDENLSYGAQFNIETFKCMKECLYFKYY